uniref:Oxygen-insensitive NADPH nitroreductase (EC) n=1 Tax=uncultured Thiotrichaceae bacterium TaxID=298394 RepID=A0A6S6TEW2_9GAMM|nr:MAG: Oxygen-insensitive NADPH nitroreductase (EC [uncultured Thiotrichaceae bacterium]
MNVSDAIKGRKSVRAFLDKAVSRKTVEAILDTARWAPSGVNTQPWKVFVLTGEKKAALQQRILERFQSGEKGAMDYQYYPEAWAEPYSGRRRQCGIDLYGALGIKREDKQRRMDQWVANYRTFDAPVMLMFTMDAHMETGSYLDYGMFLQSVMLAAMDNDLTTCPQAALAEYPNVVREFLGLDESQLVLCGMALGYEDTDAPVNNYRTVREEVAGFTVIFWEG